MVNGCTPDQVTILIVPSFDGGPVARHEDNSQWIGGSRLIKLNRVMGTAPRSRLSIGIEDCGDIKEDVDQALEKAAP